MVHLKRALKACATLAALALSLRFVNAALMRYDEHEDKYLSFLKGKADYDVLFPGTSHVQDAVHPMQLWNDYGITSFNIGNGGATIPSNYWMIQLAQKYHKPKIAMFDLYWLWESYKNDKIPLARTHQMFDTFPLSLMKLQAVRDLHATNEGRAEAIFRLYSYHNRWKDKKFKFKLKDTLKRFFVKYKQDVTKGLPYSYVIGVSRKDVGAETNICYEGTESTGMEYCRKIIAYCKENDIIPIFMLIPYADARRTQTSSENTDAWISALRSILEEEGVLFLDMLDGVVDFDIDSFEGSHLNPSGARKVTDAIGAFLSETLGCQSHKDDPAFAAWHDDYDAYRQWLLATIARQGNFKNLLMMTNHAEVYAAVRAGNNAAFDAVEEKLLFENWSDIRFERTGVEDAAVTVTVFERGTDREVVTRRFEKEQISGEE